MDVTFVNPGVDDMLQSIMAFQEEGQSPFWSEPLYHFYPQLDRAYANRLPFPERKDYIERTLRAVYAQLEDTINEKARLYSRHWANCRGQITAALTDAFGVDCANLFNDLRCHVSMNPICPRFLRERRFDVFYLNSERGAIGLSIHELIHFVWFHVWRRLFGDRWEEYETPSLKWILSEMAVEPVMRDPRLSSINPYFPRENGGCIYPYFFDMEADGAPILDTLDEMYRTQGIEDFMKTATPTAKPTRRKSEPIFKRRNSNANGAGAGPSLTPPPIYDTILANTAKKSRPLAAQGRKHDLWIRLPS